MDIKSQNPGSAPGENQDDDSPEIILPVEAGKLEKALKEVERLQEKVKTLNQSNNSLKKDLQSALEENEFLSFIINEVDVVIYTNTINDDGSWDISWINNRVEEITWFTLSEIRASGTIQHFKDTFAPEHLNLVSDSWQYFMSGEKGNYSGVYRRKHKDGNWKWIYCIGHATQWRPDGSPLQTLCVGFDLTKRINIDKNLRDLLYENLKLKNQDLIETLTKR
jgi:PAS domain-containing protein